MTDLAAIGVLGSLLLACVAAGEGLRARGWATESTRRVVHLGTGLTVAASPAWGPGPVYVLAVAFWVATAIVFALGWGPAMRGIRRRWVGTVAFPLALLVALALCWTLDPGRVFALQIAFAVLALADPAASLGRRWSRGGAGGAGGASVAGSSAFALVAFVVAASGVLLVGPWGWGASLGAALVVAALATVAEALARDGWDNLWVGVAVTVALAALDAGASVGGAVAAVGLAGAFGGWAWRVGALQPSGALAGGGFAWMLVALGGADWIVPGLAFFVLSSALSRLGRARKAAAQQGDQKGSRRDAGQVFANGGAAALALAATVFAPEPWLYGAFVGALAAAAADTWATEIGTWVGGPTRWLGVGSRVAPGRSGGMSVAGTVGGVLGATSVVLAAAAVGDLDARLAVGLIGAASAGAFTDSVLGATLQARYRQGDRWSERPLGREAPAHGWAWLDNDGVNWACTTVGALGGAWVWAVGS